MTQLEQIHASAAPFYPYGESLTCLDCGATFHRSLPACPACGSRTSWNPARWTGEKGNGDDHSRV